MKKRRPGRPKLPPDRKGEARYQFTLWKYFRKVDENEKS